MIRLRVVLWIFGHKFVVLAAESVRPQRYLYKALKEQRKEKEVFTFVQTISTGMPRLYVSVLSPSGSTTASSSPAVVARLCGDWVASSGSAYSWNAFTTGEKTKIYKDNFR